jgi:hypothetical protein
MRSDNMFARIIAGMAMEKDTIFPKINEITRDALFDRCY